MLKTDNFHCKQPRMLMNNCVQMNAIRRNLLISHHTKIRKKKKVSTALSISQFFKEGLYQP